MNSLYQTIISSSNSTQKIFVVVKPGFLNLSDKVIKIFKEHGWCVGKTVVKKLLLKEAREMYKMHKKEDFYKPLCDYMSSDICRAFIFIKPGHQTPKTFKDVAKIKDDIREKYGESDMRNVLHSSDSYKAFTHESQVYFYNINQEDLL